MSLLIATGGVGAYFIGGAFSSTEGSMGIVGKVLQGVGIVTIGYGVYHLFAASKEEIAKQQSQPSASPTPLASAESFTSIIGRFVTPKGLENVSLDWRQRPPGVSVQVSNPSNQPVSFMVRLTQSERATPIFGSPGGAETAIIPPKAVNLGPREEQIIPFDISTISVPLWNVLEETLTAEKISGSQIEPLRDAAGNMAKVTYYLR